MTFEDHGNAAPEPNRKRDAVPTGNEAYVSALAEVVPTMFMLNADRRLDSDTVPDPSDEMELRRVMRYEEPRRINELVVSARDSPNSGVKYCSAMERKAVIGANKGSMNVHSVCVNVLQHVLAPNASRDDSISESTADTLLNQLAAIQTKTAQHARYELATELSTCSSAARHEPSTCGRSCRIQEAGKDQTLLAIAEQPKSLARLALSRGVVSLSNLRLLLLGPSTPNAAPAIHF